MRWEAATAPAEDAGVRVALLRTGLVIGRGAMLMQVLGLVFKAGLGGRLGSGRQYWPWISLRDEIDAIRFLLTADVSGPVNLTAPTPVTNAEFTRELGRVVHRPTVLAVPGFAISAALGEFARSSILGGQRALLGEADRSGLHLHPHAAGRGAASGARPALTPRRHPTRSALSIRQPSGVRSSTMRTAAAGRPGACPQRRPAVARAGRDHLVLGPAVGQVHDGAVAVDARPGHLDDGRA